MHKVKSLTRERDRQNEEYTEEEIKAMQRKINQEMERYTKILLESESFTTKQKKNSLLMAILEDKFKTNK